MTIGNRIQAVREARGIRRAELARRMGVAKTSIQRWETDVSSPSWYTLERIASGLGVSVSAFILQNENSFFLSGLSSREYNFFVSLLADRDKLDALNDIFLIGKKYPDSVRDLLSAVSRLLVRVADD